MKEALKLALDVLNESWHLTPKPDYVRVAITAIEAALAQPAQEPVGVFCEDDDIGYVRLIPHQQMKLKAWDKLYTTPQQRPWVGLTDEERDAITDKVIGFNSCCGWEDDYAKAIEAKLKEKNT